MQFIKKLFTDSVQELRKTRSLAMAAMLLAVAVVIGFFSVQVTESIKVSFAFLADELTGMLFGPVVGAIQGGLADLLKYIIRPTGPFFPGFTISEALTGFVYGLLLYKRPLRLPRVILANSIVTVGINMFLNTYWLSMLYGNAYMVMFPARVVKELILLPINIAMFYILCKLLSKAKLFRMINSPQ